MTPVEIIIAIGLLGAWTVLRERRYRHRRTLSAEYRAYMASPQWQRVRRQELARAGYRCEHPFCRRSRPLHVHHLTYAHFGHERPGELRVLCPRHHRKAHRKWRAPSSYRR